MAMSSHHGVLVKGVIIVALCLTLAATLCEGFTVHKRHPHHHLRHQGQGRAAHRPHPESPDDKEAQAVDALYEALESAELSDAVWGSGGDDVDPGVPLFMKLLLRDTEKGAVFSEYSQPVAPTMFGSNNKTLASCVQPARVTVGRAGAMVVEFPYDGVDQADDARGWWLVLSLRPGFVAGPGVDPDAARLSVFLAVNEGQQPHDLHDVHDAHNVKLLAQHTLPNATFVAVDVTKAVKATAGSWPRFVIDVRSPTAGVASAASAATVLEVAGWERGPLLVSALNWGEDTSEEGSMRVWTDLPGDLLHPPRTRSRRRSHRKTTTTTEGPSYSSAENPLRNAATAEMTPDSNEDEDASPSGAGDAGGAGGAGRAGGQPDERYCHLEAWTVSTVDLGWEFIVAPKTIDINFCVGRCPPLLLDQQFNASTNAMARTAIKKERGAEAGANIPDAQCVPIRYKPIALLMRSKEGRVDLFTSYDLSADRCGCR